MLAAGFFHVGCVMTLKRMYCLFVPEVGSRYVHILGITTNPGRAVDDTADPESADGPR